MPLNISERRPLLSRNIKNLHRARRSTSVKPLPQPNAIDFSGNSRHEHFRKQAASATILLSLVFERIAFYGLSGNLVLFLTEDPFQWQTIHAVNASLYFLGVCFATSLIGGWLADAILGRFKAILISFLIYIAGYVFLPLIAPRHSSDNVPTICRWGHEDNEANTAMNPFEEPCAWLTYITLTIIAVGVGFVKANIAPFGSDQVAKHGQQATLSFFNWLYWSINLGALVGLSLITYIQQRYLFFTGYIVSISCLGVSVVLFVAGRCVYEVRAPDGSVLTNIIRILREAFQRRNQRKRKRNSQRNSQLSPGKVDSAESVEASISFLDYAKHRHGGIFHDTLVDDVKQLKKIFAVFAVLIPYWLVYFQMETTFLVQGLRMRLGFGESNIRHGNTSNGNSTDHDRNFQLVAAWFSLFDVITLILLLPLFDRVIYPWIERRSGKPVTILWRIVLGMIFAAVAMIIAGVVEHSRLQTFWPNSSEPCVNESISQYIGNTEYDAANMSIFWQIPQYILIGLSEVFASVAGLQFAVSVAPRSMKGIIMGLFYLFSGIGSFLGTAIISGLSASDVWFLSPNYGDINCRLGCSGNSTTVTKECHLDYYFYLLAGIEVLGALLFVLVAKAFHLEEHHRHRKAPQQLETSGEFLDPSTVRRESNRSPFHSIQRQNSQHT